MDVMRKEPPIAVCAFGWGQVFRLYHGYLEVNGTCYALSDLTHIHPVYQHVLGIPSVRLELRFGKKSVTLRGIAAIEDAQRVIEYMTSHYLGLQWNDSRLDNSSSVGWKKTRMGEESETLSAPKIAQEKSESESVKVSQDLRLQEFTQAPTAKVETAPNWLRFRHDQRERRQRRLYVERSLREHGFDVEQLEQRLKEETLPEVSVPVHLLSGEHAHYSTDATLCGEPVGEVIRFTYPAKDHGTLILTNRRLIYIGRKSQIVLDYARLLHVSRLRGAIAFQADHWYKREIFEVRRPLECTMFLDCILQQFQPIHPFHLFMEEHLEDEEHEQSEDEHLDAVSMSVDIDVDIDTMPLSKQWDKEAGDYRKLSLPCYNEFLA
jgi:hypothetical protein